MIATHQRVVDLFAGGGGASEGIRQALGRGPADSPLDLAEVVVYRSVADAGVWVRPTLEFLARFEVIGG